MRILLVAATRPEVEPLLSRLQVTSSDERFVRGRFGAHEVECLLTGVGMVATAVWCARALATSSYDVALNFGVCGSFNPLLPVSSVVHVTSETLPELGVEDGPRFLSLQEIGLLRPDDFPWRGGRLVNAVPPPLPEIGDLPSAAGVTVNTVHGDESSIARVSERSSPDVESMEGAAFMFACLTAGVPFAEVRAVSNRVERRNREAWDLAGAITRLNETAARLLTPLPSKIP